MASGNPPRTTFLQDLANRSIRHAPKASASEGRGHVKKVRHAIQGRLGDTHVFSRCQGTRIPALEGGP